MTYYLTIEKIVYISRTQSTFKENYEREQFVYKVHNMAHRSLLT